MICKYCGGIVEWVGKIYELHSTKCLDCGSTNCQIIEEDTEEDDK